MNDVYKILIWLRIISARAGCAAASMNPPCLGNLYNGRDVRLFVTDMWWQSISILALRFFHIVAVLLRLFFFFLFLNLFIFTIHCSLFFFFLSMSKEILPLSLFVYVYLYRVYYTAYSSGYYVIMMMVIIFWRGDAKKRSRRGKKNGIWVISRAPTPLSSPRKRRRRNQWSRISSSEMRDTVWDEEKRGCVRETCAGNTHRHIRHTL